MKRTLIETNYGRYADIHLLHSFAHAAHICRQYFRCRVRACDIYRRFYHYSLLIICNLIFMDKKLFIICVSFAIVCVRCFIIICVIVECHPLCNAYTHYGTRRAAHTHTTTTTNWLLLSTSNASPAGNCRAQ